MIVSSEFEFCFFHLRWESVSQEDILVDTAAMTQVDLVMMEDMWINLMGMGPMITMVPMIAMDMDTAAMVEAGVAVTVAVIR